MKKILVISYSQSGQLDEIIDNFLIPFDDTLIDRIKINPKTPIPFPYASREFFDLMPECVLEEKTELEPIHYQTDAYELIIIGYQPWYLSPSLPSTALFQDEKFSALLKDKPVITVIGARNMWLNSQESVKKYISNAGGKLVSNIPFIDRNNNLVSAVTILRWMLTGRKQKYLKIFPLPGISEKDIKGAKVFGEQVFKAFKENLYENLQNRILDLQLINIKTDILFIEARAKKIFRVFAALIKKHGSSKRKRAMLVKFFKYYLFVALFVLAPLVLLIYYIFFMPFLISSIKRKKEYFLHI